MGVGGEGGDGEEGSGGGEESGGDERGTQLVEVDRQRRLEYKTRDEREEDEISSDGREPDTGNQADRDTSRGEKYRVRNRGRGSRNEAKQCGHTAEHDQEEEEALGCGHQRILTRRPP